MHAVPNRSKEKGARFEREMVELLVAAGIPAQRVPLSGSVKGGSFESDIEALVHGIERKIECKRRARGCTTFYGFLDGAWAVVMRDDRTEPLVLMRFADFVQLVNDTLR